MRLMLLVCSMEHNVNTRRCMLTDYWWTQNASFPIGATLRFARHASIYLRPPWNMPPWLIH